jgi:hypothetical protein
VRVPVAVSPMGRSLTCGLTGVFTADAGAATAMVDATTSAPPTAAAYDLALILAPVLCKGRSPSLTRYHHEGRYRFSAAGV